MGADFPEVKEMVEAAKLYLGGSVGIHELHGAVAQCAHAAKMFSAHPAITEMAGDWLSMVNRYWNEWGLEPEPLSDAQFREWLQNEVSGEQPIVR